MVNIRPMDDRVVVEVLDSDSDSDADSSVSLFSVRLPSAGVQASSGAVSRRAERRRGVVFMAMGWDVVVGMA